MRELLIAYWWKITTVPLEFTTKSFFEMPRKKLHRSRKNFNTVGKTSPPLEKLHQRGKNFIDLRGLFWWSFSNPLVYSQYFRPLVISRRFRGYQSQAWIWVHSCCSTSIHPFVFRFFRTLVIRRKHFHSFLDTNFKGVTVSFEGRCVTCRRHEEILSLFPRYKMDL